MVQDNFTSDVGEEHFDVAASHELPIETNHVGHQPMFVFLAEILERHKRGDKNNTLIPNLFMTLTKSHCLLHSLTQSEETHDSLHFVLIGQL